MADNVKEFPNMINEQVQESYYKLISSVNPA